jgi:hypothetical protein
MGVGAMDEGPVDELEQLIAGLLEDGAPLLRPPSSDMMMGPPGPVPQPPSP